MSHDLRAGAFSFARPAAKTTEAKKAPAVVRRGLAAEAQPLKRLLLLLFAATAILAQAQVDSHAAGAGEKTDRFHAYGLYDTSCGVWTATNHERVRRPISETIAAAGIRRAAMAEWVSGFLSGINFAHRFSDAINDSGLIPIVLEQKITDDAAIVLWVDKRCDEHPLAHVRRFFGPLTPECSENGRKTMIACLIHVNPSDTI